MAAISIDNAFGIHDDALKFRAYRTDLLASNMANADTPEYKARDIDFKSLFDDTRERLPLTRTDSRHLSAPDAPSEPVPLYRIPHQPSLDGNTVDPELEKTAFAEHTLQYQATLDFLGGRITGLRNAMRKE